MHSCLPRSHPNPTTLDQNFFNQIPTNSLPSTLPASTQRPNPTAPLKRVRAKTLQPGISDSDLARIYFSGLRQRFASRTRPIGIGRFWRAILNERRYQELDMRSSGQNPVNGMVRRRTLETIA